MMDRNWHIVAAVAMALTMGFAAAGGVGTALAQAGALPDAGPGGGVDFGPVLTNVVETVAGALMLATTAAAGFAVRFLMSRIGMQDSQLEHLAVQRLDEVLHLSIDYAEGWMKAQVADPRSSVRHMAFDNIFLEAAAKYAAASAPGLLAQFGITEQRLKDMLLARLNRIMATPEADSGTARPVVGPQPPEATA